MGIRKAVGASVSSLLLLLTSGAAKSVIIGNAIAAPIAYVVIASWLQDYAIRMDVGMSLFLPAALLSFLLAMLAVGGRSLQAARANPIDALRYE